MSSFFRWSFRPTGLNARLFLITTLGVLGTMVVVLFFSYRSFEQMMAARFQEKIRFLLRHLSSSAILALAFRDEKALARLAGVVFREEGVTGVVIEDAAGKVLVRLGEPGPKDLRLTKMVVSKVPEEGLVFGGERGPKTLGRVVIYFSTSAFKRRMRRLLFQSIAVGLFLALLIDLLLYFLVSRAVTTPLKSLLDGVKRVQAGELSFNTPRVSLSEVRELSEAFAEMVNSLKESRAALARSYEEMLRNKTLAEVGHFSLMIAHEIKNPLGIIKGALDLLRKEEVSPEIRAQMISYIEEEVSRIDSLVKSFLAFARPKKLRFEPLELAELLEMVARKAGLEHGKTQVHLNLKDRPKIRGDASWLEQVFFNLIKNAFEAGAKNVWLELEEEGEKVLVKIYDDGPGIPDEKKKEVFKPFYTEKTKGGMGLGLAIAEQIIKLHGGSIRLEDHPKGGALFSVILPKKDV